MSGRRYLTLCWRRLHRQPLSGSVARLYNRDIHSASLQVPVHRYLLISITLLAASLQHSPFVAFADAADYTLLERFPHHGVGYTQGLELHGHILYESSGLYGRSWVARSRFPAPVKTEVTRRRLERKLFAEGLTVLNNTLYLLTWRSERGLLFDAQTLAPRGEFHFDGEGWGLANNGRELILSNGTDTLQFIDPASFEVTRRVTVRYRGEPVNRINELEYHDGRLIANHWGSDHLLVIEPNSGNITQVLRLHELYPEASRAARADVMNGIAYDAHTDTWLVTGKRWPWIYRVKLHLQPRATSSEKE